jgi:hypothetical protein
MKKLRYTKDKLYELLPAIYRQRDSEEEGKPLYALLSVIAEQAGFLEKDIEKLYDNWFIETCDEWVVPYIADLIDAKILHSVTKATFSQRAWVANTLSYRRRKGTLAMLEQLARDVTDWNARAVEFFQLLCTTQYLNHLRMSNVCTLDLRNSENLDLLDTPFDKTSHFLDVRNIASNRGYYNIPNIGLFLWRLQAFPVVNCPAFNHGDGKFSFNQLGYDMPLFNHPETETSASHIAEEVNVPEAIRRKALHYHLKDYYSNDDSEKSIKIQVNYDDLTIDHIVVCDLTDWRHRSSGRKVAIDPVLGRIFFPTDMKPKSVHVNYYYGFSSEVGGGFYQRNESEHEANLMSNFNISSNRENFKTYKISKKDPIINTINDAIKKWIIETGGKQSATLEISDSEIYEEEISEVELDDNITLEISASEKQRPTIRLTGPLKVKGKKDTRNSNLVLDGLILDKSTDSSGSGDSILLNINDGDLHHLIIRHCTIVPVRDPAADDKDKKSMQLRGSNDYLQIFVIRSIVGSVHIVESEAQVIVLDSIIDGGKGSENEALTCYKAILKNSTLIGKVNVTILELASNCIFTDKVLSTRRQIGCVRFCHIPEGSQVPRRYHCQPEYPPMISDDMKDIFALKISPRFTSKRYGDPGYAQLVKDIPDEIFKGADNEAEMGTFNHLYQPQRIRNLKASLDEYLRFGLEAGIFLIT